MGRLENLRTLTGRNDLAKALGFEPKFVSYILYKMPEKYQTFTIPKKSGGTRTIQAPTKRLRLLQRRLAEQLYLCIQEVQKEDKAFLLASHGFQKKRTIVSNAQIHRQRRYVFNIDLLDFFGTINFGRVRGFFIKDSRFKLKPDVATAIAQIACYENALPQGSPCSPVISNLVGNILDSRLLALARDCRCTYTRYADDLTYSTNQKRFPDDIATHASDGGWKVGEKLYKIIGDTGFEINPSKTRMSLRQSRQTVTGLVVNVKPNIKREYYRATRAMCHSLFQTGKYYCVDHDKHNPTDNLMPLEGMLSHICFVKARLDRSNMINRDDENLKGLMGLYSKLLFYKYFVALKKPLIVTEGITDIIYLKCAIENLVKKSPNGFPNLATVESDKVIRLVNFFKPPKKLSNVLYNLGQGSANQAKLLGEYSKKMEKYGHKPMAYPVILLCDNDKGLKKIAHTIQDRFQKEVSDSTKEDFYHLEENLYLVKVPEGDPPEERAIEKLFDENTLPPNASDSSTSSWKMEFAKETVVPGVAKINFEEFKELLVRINKVLKNYKSPSI